MAILGAAIIAAALGAALGIRTFLLAFFYLLGLSFFGLIADALRTGLAVTESTWIIDRSTEPKSFWAILVFYAALGGITLWIAVMHLTLRAV